MRSNAVSTTEPIPAQSPDAGLFHSLLFGTAKPPDRPVTRRIRRLDDKNGVDPFEFVSNNEDMQAIYTILREAHPAWLSFKEMLEQTGLLSVDLSSIITSMRRRGHLETSRGNRTNGGKSGNLYRLRDTA